MLRKFLSKVLNRRIDKPGIGITSGNEVFIMPGVDLDKIEYPESKFSIKYKLNSDAGSFELIGIVKGKKNPAYKLRSCLTGEEFSVSDQLFNFLFTKLNLKETK